jgi:hypothetical protein
LRKVVYSFIAQFWEFIEHYTEPVNKLVLVQQHKKDF